MYDNKEINITLIINTKNEFYPFYFSPLFFSFLISLFPHQHSEE